MRKFYTLNINLGDYEAGRIIADDGDSWIMASDDYLDHRGSIREGELAMLLDSARDRNLTSILEPFGDDDPAPPPPANHTNVTEE